jgi:uncharacterized protein (TIGR02996 family)
MGLNRRGSEGEPPGGSPFPSDGDALRQAILAQPDDDIARLVYADWLEENGQPERAAFIRAQVWAAQAEPYSPDARKHTDTADKLRNGREGPWTKHLSQWVEWKYFWRGFIERAQVNVASFPRHAAALFAAEPIRSLKMTRYRPTVGELVSLLPFFEVPQLERITRLDLTGLNLAPVELEPIAECPFLSALTDLCLRNLPVLPEWITELLRGPALPNLAGLDLADISNLHLRLATELPKCKHRRFLRLDLSHIAFTSDEMIAVLDSRCLRELEELRLGWMPSSGRVGPLSLLDLSWGLIPWNRLRLLDLAGQGLGDSGVSEIVKALERHKDLAPLRWLGLAHNGLGAEGVRALVRSDPARLQLYYLDVRGHFLTLAQLAALQQRFPEAVIKSRDE